MEPQRNARYLSAFGAFLITLILAKVLHIRFVYEIIPVLWQYLDVEILKKDLLRGIFYLHSQPPLFNLYLGIALKAAGAYTPQALEVVSQLCVLGILLGMTWLMEALRIRSSISIVMVLLLSLLPALVVYSNYAFYTVPVAFLLVVSAAALQKALTTGKARWFHLFWCLAAAVMLTRATYNYIWFLLVLSAGIYLLPSSHRKVWVRAALIPILIVTVVYVKNYALAGVMGPSSWVGMNLSKGWIVTDPGLYRWGASFSPEEAKDFCDVSGTPLIWAKGPFQPPDAYREFGFFPDDAHFRDTIAHPALTAAYKVNGVTNYNHRDYATISAILLRGTIAAISHNPARYLRRLWVAYRLYLQPGPGPSWTFTRFYDFEPVTRYRDALTGALLLARAEDLPRGILPANLLFIIFPVTLAFSAWRAFSTRSPENLIPAFLAITVLSAAISGIAVELGENDRIRWETDPLLFVLIGCCLEYLRKFLARYAKPAN